MADATLVDAWPVEQIPDSDRVFYRVHKTFIRDGLAVPGAFKDRAGAMSVDWQKYSSPLQSRNRAKIPSDNAIVECLAGDLRHAVAQQVIHSPDTQRLNRAHTDVVGAKDEEVRLILSRTVRFSITLETSATLPDDPPKDPP